MKNNGPRRCGKRKVEINVVQILANQIAESYDQPETTFSISDPSTYASLVRKISKTPENLPNSQDIAFSSSYNTVAVNTIKLIDSVNHLVQAHEVLAGKALCYSCN